MSDISPAALPASQAARYLSVSRSHFFAHIRQHVPVIDVRRPGSKRAMYRWLPSDLDRFLMDRRKESV